MDTIITPHDHDVLAGRELSITNHPGNISFRMLIAHNLRAYTVADNRGKKSIVLQIIRTIQKTNPPGRFILLNKNTGLWNYMSNEKAYAKACQTLRDCQVRVDLLIVEVWVILVQGFCFNDLRFRNNFDCIELYFCNQKA